MEYIWSGDNNNNNNNYAECIITIREVINCQRIVGDPLYLCLLVRSSSSSDLHMQHSRKSS